MINMGRPLDIAASPQKRRYPQPVARQNVTCSDTRPHNKDMPPPGRACPICGRMFGSSSLEIHIPQCQRKTLQQWVSDPATRDRAVPASLAMGHFPGASGGPPLDSRRAAAGSRASLAAPSAATPAVSLVSAPRRGALADAFAAASSGPLNLVPCRFCNRKFSSDRIGKHEGACVSSRSARQQFDTRTQRLGDLMEAALPGKTVGFGKRKAPVTVRGAMPRAAAAPRGGRSVMTSSPGFSAGYLGAQQRDWRAEHRDFIESIRAAKRAAPPKPAQAAVHASSSPSVGGRLGFAGASTLRRGAAPAPRTRQMVSSPAASGGGAGPRQLNILPTNDTSAGMWAAMGRDLPSYGTYGPLGSRRGGRR